LRKAAPYSRGAPKKKSVKMDRKLQLRLKEDVSDKIHIFGAKNFLPLMLKRTSATAGTHVDLPVSDAIPEEANNKKVIVHGIVVRNGKKCPIISVMDTEWVTVSTLPGSATPECVALALSYIS
jgi:hypothetical protein